MKSAADCGGGKHVACLTCVSCLDGSLGHLSAVLLFHGLGWVGWGLSRHTAYVPLWRQLTGCATPSCEDLAVQIVQPSCRLEKRQQPWSEMNAPSGLVPEQQGRWACAVSSTSYDAAEFSLGPGYICLCQLPRWACLNAQPQASPTA